MDTKKDNEVKKFDATDEEPLILDEIEIEELFVDGICGVY
jgi:mycofactocin precursor